MSDKLTEILDWFRRSIEENLPISPVKWLESASKLNLLMEDIDNKIAEFECVMADEEMRLVENGETVAKSKILKRKVVDYKEYLKLKAIRERVTEHIRIAKKRQEINEF